MTDWPVKTLGEVCDFVRGVTYDKVDARTELKSGFIPLLRATNITEKGLLREDFVFIPKNGVRADQKLISGDALITIASGSASVVGRSVLVEDPGEMTFGAFCGVLRPSPEILPRYLSHFMSSRTVRTAWSEAAQGTNINNLKRDDILQTECLVPPLDKQKRIVALLDAATANVAELTACYEQARTHAKNLFTSALRDALEGNSDWPVKTLGEVAKWGSGGTPQSGVASYYGGDIPWCVIGDLTEGDVWLTEKSITEAGLLNSSAKLVDVGAVLIAMYGASIGRTGVVRTRMATNQAIAFAYANQEIVHSDFLLMFLQSQKQSFVDAGQGAAQPNISQLVLKEWPISLPPLVEQKWIVARFDSMKAKTSEMVAAYDAKLTAAKNLRQSILEAAFAGEL